jgi:hypothetical protein
MVNFGFGNIDELGRAISKPLNEVSIIAKVWTVG